MTIHDTIIELPDGIAKPEYAAIFEPRATFSAPDKSPRFFVFYPHPEGGTNNRGDGPRMTAAKSNRRPPIVTGHQTRWSVLIEECKLYNVDPHILFVGRPLRIAVEPYEYDHALLDGRYGGRRTAYSLVAIHVGGTFDKHEPLDELVRATRELFK
jgi:hypothetical protein